MKRNLGIITILIMLVVIISGCQNDNPSATRYSLGVDILGEGTVNPRAGLYAKGEILTFYIEPAAGWYFSHWEGTSKSDVRDNQHGWQLLMNGDKRLTAVFLEKDPGDDHAGQYVLNVTIEGQGTIAPASGKYEPGEMITFTLNPSNGWYFALWSGANAHEVIDMGTSYGLCMNGNKDLIGIFNRANHQFLISVEGQGEIEAKLLAGEKDASGKYSHGSVVRLWAQPASGWEFTRWSSSDLDLVNQDIINVTIEKDLALKAVFSKKETLYNLKINILGQGQVEEKLINDSKYPADSLILLKAKAHNGWSFNSWLGDEKGDLTEIYIKLDRDKEITALFTEDAKEFYLNLEIIGEGKVKKNPDSDKYEAGTLVTLEALASPGWEFSKWQGDLTSRNPQGQLEMDSNKYVYAMFVEAPENYYSINLDVLGEGRVTKTPHADEYLEGTEVVLSAEAAKGWEFIEWQGAVKGSKPNVTIIMDEDKQIKALFEEKEISYPLNVTITGSGSVIKNPSRDEYPAGTKVSLRAQASSGWYFKEWQGGASGSNAEIQLVMDGPKEVTAVFESQNSGYKLDLAIIPGSHAGSIKLEPDQAYYPAGTKVKLTAIPSSKDYCFVFWIIEDRYMTSNPLIVEMNKDTFVQVKFLDVPEG